MEIVVAGLSGLPAFEFARGNGAADDADFFEDGKEAAVGLQFVEGFLPWAKKELFDFHGVMISRNDDEENSSAKANATSESHRRWTFDQQALSPRRLDAKMSPFPIKKRKDTEYGNTTLPSVHLRAKEGDPNWRRPPAEGD